MVCKIVFSRNLRIALNTYATHEEPTPQDAWDIYTAFLDSWSFQRYVISRFYDFSSSLLGNFFNRFKKAGLLTNTSGQDNWQKVAIHPDPWSVDFAFTILHDFGLLSDASAQENWQAVATHQNPVSVAGALLKLHNTGLLAGTPAHNRQAVATHPDPVSVADALLKLHNTGLLTGTSAQDNWQAVATHPVPDEVASTLITLHAAGLLTGASAQNNWQAVVTYPFPRRLTSALSLLRDVGLLTQAHLNALLTYSDILLADNIYELWYWIPPYRLTQEVFNQILQLAQQYQTNPQEARQRFWALVDRDLLNIEAETEQVINTGQSTHTASVHASVSQSAIKLLNRYGQAISNHTTLNDILRAMTAWIDSLSTSEPKEAAAQRGFHRIVTIDYIDSVSQVSIQQLLALAWLAIQDKKHIQGTREDLERLLIDGLYEIQRGYNLSETGNDNGGPDRPICIGGTFNKLMEKLSGQHPDVELIFISIATASAKFKIIVNEEIVAYLSSLDNFDETERGALNEALRDNAASALFTKVVTQVSERVFNEFAPLFKHNKQSQTFRGLIDSGEYVALSETTINRLTETLNQRVATATNPQSFFQPQPESLHAEPAEAEEQNFRFKKSARSCQGP